MYTLTKDTSFTGKHARDPDGKVYDNILQAIGNTPLVRLNRLPRDHGLDCEIYAKCEFLNPGGSIKDRISYTMVMHAEETGLARPGTRFVEPTSGNTGIGVSLAAAVKGYGCTIVTPDKNSDEKISTIKLLGASVVQTPTKAPFDDPDNFMNVANRLLKEDSNAVSLDQYSNNMNPLTHYEHTAEEILSAVGEFDMMVMGAGTGGTLTGVAHKLRERLPHCVIVAVDPLGSVMFHEDSERRMFFVEGIGGDFLPNVLDKTVVDKLERPTDYQAFNMAREVIKKEGLLCGGSSGAAMYSAIKLAKELKLGAGKRVVVILPDGIRNYMSKFVSDQWMEAHHFKPPPDNRQLTWWNEPIYELKYNTSVPKLPEHASCYDALAAMGTHHNVCIVIDDNGFLQGVVSKNSLRNEATNPKIGQRMNMNDSVKDHCMKTYYKLVESESSSSIGLVSRILDIAPFVVVVDTFHDREWFKPKGVITPETVLDYIIKHQTVNKKK